jgi:cysteine synthase
MSKGKIIRRSIILAGATALAVTACGGSGASSSAAPGQWTQAEVNQFVAAGGSGGSSGFNSCVAGLAEKYMSFQNAMDLVAVDPASSSLTTTQIEAAVTSKYGSQASTINAQFNDVIGDAGSCSSS